jgi:carboxylesterase type B
MVSFAAVLFALLTHKMITLSEFVEVKQGMIEGTVMETRQGEKFDAFLNIPYAQKPLGRLRFQAPLEVLPWDGVKNGTAWGPMCTQVNLLSNSPTSEDCLSLNVFTKNLRSQQPLKPVIVYIHGGAFQLGSASDHQPHLLMERDVVLVSLNYRLGAFGFLSLGTKEVPGNQGMKDQVLALRWIKKNVEAFGGNSEMITLMGNSAGAYSVTAHMVSPMADGLFQRVIAFSGAITWQNKFEENYLDLAMKLAQKLNCTTSTIEDMAECLRSVRGFFPGQSHN